MSLRNYSIVQKGILLFFLSGNSKEIKKNTAQSKKGLTRQQECLSIYHPFLTK